MYRKNRKRRRVGIPLAMLAAALVLLVAVLAGSSLWMLRRLHRQVAHEDAARSVLAQGQVIAGYLSRDPAVTGAGGTAASWDAFSRQVRLLHKVQSGLQYVSVTEGDLTLFQEQTTALDGQPRGDAAPGAEADGAQVEMTRRLLTVGQGEVPVVVFSAKVPAGAGEPPRVVEVALRKATVEREEQAAARAIASMFRVSLATVVIAFAACVVLVAWLMHREVLREKLRREEEHLAFAGVMANGIVHDFRNPMSALRLDAQMAEKEAAKGAGCRPERLAELAGRMRGTLDRMDKVFQEFFYLSKPPSNQRERVKLGAVMREALATLTPRLEQARLRVVQQIDDGVEVIGFASSLQRALLNVLANAEQFSRPGGEVRVGVARSGSHAVVEIIDDGPGIPEADRERIFEMFVTTRPGGTGLGLYLARTAVERCGGTIRVTGGPRGGSCFRITLPLAEGGDKP